MGRIIKPDEIRNMIDCINIAMNKDKMLLQEVEIQIHGFEQTNELQGIAWTGMKNQISSHDIVIRGLIYLVDAMIEAGNSLKLECGTEYLHEDTLLEQMKILEQRREQYNDVIEAYRRQLTNDIYQVCMNDYARSQILKYERLIVIIEEKMSIIREKLNSINVIDNATKSLMQPVKELIKSVEQAIKILSSSWQDNKFIKTANDFTWMTELITKSQEKVENTKVLPEINGILENLEKDYKEGIIEIEVYNSIKTGLLAGGLGFAQNIIVQKVSDIGTEAISDAIYTWIKRNTTALMNQGMDAAFVEGGEYLIQETPNLLKRVVRGGTKYALPLIGTVIDCGLQIVQGENSVDAGIKAVSHTAIGIGSAKLGATIGTAIGGPLGLAVGAAAGFVIGVAGSMVFDWIYDNKDTIAEGIKTTVNDIGNAVVDFFSGVSHIFT